jgi:hypothetical protein
MNLLLVAMMTVSMLVVLHLPLVERVEILPLISN